MSDSFQIQLNIAGKYYAVPCRRSEEGMIRKAAKNVTEKLLKYGSAYADREPPFEREELLALVAFHFSRDILKAQKNEDISPVFDKIEQLNEEMRNYLLGETASDE